MKPSRIRYWLGILKGAFDLMLTVALMIVEPAPLFFQLLPEATAVSIKTYYYQSVSFS